MDRTTTWAAFRAADGEGAGGAAAGGEGGGAPAGADPAGQGGAAAGAAAAQAETPPKPWWDATPMPDEVRAVLLENGFHRSRGEDGQPKDATIEEGLVKALASYRAATQKLGAKPEELARLPGEKQSLGEWMKALGPRVGVPPTPDAYDIGKPELPEGVPYDDGFEKRALEKFHAKGMPKEFAKLARDVYAEEIAGLFQSTAAQQAEALAAMNAQLQRDWGQQAQLKQGQAARAFQHFAGQAGLDAESQTRVAAKLSEVLGGDAQVVKLFAAIADQVAEDRLVGGGGAFAGAGAPMTPEAARARMSQIKGPDGEWAKAQRLNDRAKMDALRAEIGRLARVQAPPEAGR